MIKLSNGMQFSFKEGVTYTKYITYLLFSIVIPWVLLSITTLIYESRVSTYFYYEFLFIMLLEKRWIRLWSYGISILSLLFLSISEYHFPSVFDAILELDNFYLLSLAPYIVIGPLLLVWLLFAIVKNKKILLCHRSRRPFVNKMIILFPIFLILLLDLSKGVDGLKVVYMSTIGDNRIPISMRSLVRQITNHVSDYRSNSLLKETILPPQSTFFYSFMGPYSDKLRRTSGTPLVDKKTAFIIIESFGYPDDARVAGVIESTIADAIGVGYSDVSSLSRPPGSTIQAEVAELCGYYGTYKTQGARGFNECLFLKTPKRAVCVHPGSSRMFRRAEFWPMLGCETTFFYESEDLRHIPSRSQNFVFKEETDTFSDTFKKFAVDPEKQFYYFLSIAGHAPLRLAKYRNSREYVRCVKSLGDENVCIDLAPNLELLSAINSMRLNFPNIRFLITGDHIDKSVSFNKKPIYQKNDVYKIILD